MNELIQREIKFKVHNLKLDLSNFKNFIDIEQIFFTDINLLEERRYRKEIINGETSYYYTLKSISDFERHKFPDVKIDEKNYEDLLILNKDRVISKRRYFIYYDGETLSEDKLDNSIQLKLDIYANHLNSLVTVEVPVTSIEDAKAIYLPIKLGVIENVTYDSRYKNRNLAIAQNLDFIFSKKQYEVTCTNLMNGIVKNDLNYGNKNNQELKFFEELGELAETILKKLKWTVESKIKGTIAEELFDVIYYLIAKLIENGIKFDMDFLSFDKKNLETFDSFKKIMKYLDSLNCNYDNKDKYQLQLLNYFQLLSGEIAALELDSQFGKKLNQEFYKNIINNMILIIFEIARVNDVDMEKAAIAKEAKNSIKYSRKSHFLVLKKEIEKKYIASSLNIDLSYFKSAEITQYYISLKPEIRLRNQDGVWYYTEKSKGTLIRNEAIEKKIEKKDAEQLLSNGYIGNPISKTRYYIYYNYVEQIYFKDKKENTILLEVDIYKSEFENKISIETEFESIDDVMTFNYLPGIDNLVDVTEDINYKNANLSQNGWPKTKVKK